MGFTAGASKFRDGLKKTALDAKVKAGIKATAAAAARNRVSSKPDDDNNDKELSCLCGVCHNLPSGPEDPVMPSGCEHLFCKSCLLPYIKRHRKCPVCAVEAAPVPRVDVGPFQMLRDLTFSLSSIDLNSNVRQGDECDHPHGVNNASVLDNPQIGRPGQPPPRLPGQKVPRTIPRVVSRQGIPGPSSSFMGWGALPPNPAPLVPGNPVFEAGSTIASPCGQIVDRAVRDTTGWKSAGKKAGPMIDEETGAFIIDQDGDGLITQAEMLYVEAEQDQWDRSWVNARRAEATVRHSKAVASREELCYGKIRTPWRPRSRAASATALKRPAKEVKIVRPAGSPPWMSRCETPKVFQLKPKRPKPALLQTPLMYRSPINTDKPGHVSHWDDEALCEGGRTPSPRPQTAPPELWRTELNDGRAGPAHPVETQKIQEGTLLSEYAFATQSTTTLGSLNSTKQRSKTPGEMWKDGETHTHHAHGLRHECNRRSSRCASRQALVFEKKDMYPMAMARIPSREAGKKSGVRDQVLPRRKNQFKTTLGHANIWSQAGTVAPKPVEKHDEKAEYKTGVDSFESHLEAKHKQDLNNKISSWMGISKPSSETKPKLGEEEKHEQAMQEWAIYEALIPLVESINVGRLAAFEDKVESVMTVFSAMDTSGAGEQGEDTISLMEFERGLRSLDITLSSETMLKAFQIFDQNSNGYLDRAEIMLAMDKLEKHALSGSHDTAGVQALLG